MSKINEYVKTLFFILLLIQISPTIVSKIKHTWIDSLEPSNKIGYLYIHGMIENSSSYSQHLNNFFKDNTIKGILLKIESSGGAAGSCQALAFDIENLKKEFPKPIITYVENTCTSGAYEIAAATDHIVATGSAIIGSIGTRIAPIFNIQPLLAKYDIECQEIVAGHYKNSVSPFNTITDAQKNMLKSVADNTYQQFAKEIAYKRHLQLNKLDQWGQGKIFNGQQAYDLKLVDALGSQTTAVNLLKKHIIPSDRKIEWVKIPSKSILAMFWDYEADDKPIVPTSLWNACYQVLSATIPLT